jgi:metallo-beta-lactamase family protein
MKLTFLGATGTVTGSRYLVETARARVLVDCGLFQGLKQLRLRNWDRPPLDLDRLDAVLLTHAHLDHTGYFPRLVALGYRGRAWCTESTAALLGLLLPDSGHLQEEEARYAERRGYSRHRPPRPLYSEDEARASLRQLTTVRWREAAEVAPGVTARWSPAGHILGAAALLLSADGRTLGFSGDLGRANDLLMRTPTPLPAVDALVVESTYGDRAHAAVDPEAALGDAVRTVAGRGGVLMIPAFAVGRAQLLMHLLARLRARGAIPRLPTFLNSPMATDVSGLYHRFRDEHRLTAAECDAMCEGVEYVNSVDQSRELNQRRGPMVIVSASGMLTGGRILHHLRAFGPDERSMLLLAGYQAAGTRGAALAAGARSLRIHGIDVPIRAEVRELPAISGHADAGEILDWLAAGGRRGQVYVTHGEPVAADALRVRIQRAGIAPVRVPDYLETVEVAPAPERSA